MDDGVSKKYMNCLKPPIPAKIWHSFKFLLKIIEDFERRGKTLSKSMRLIDTLKSQVNQIPDEKGNLLRYKLKNYLEKNPGLADLDKINKILQGDGWMPRFMFRKLNLLH